MTRLVFHDGRSAGAFHGVMQLASTQGLEEDSSLANHSHALCHPIL